MGQDARIKALTDGCRAIEREAIRYVTRSERGSVPYSPQMADPIDVETLEALRSKGATKVAFHPNGALASVEFGPVASDGEPQNEASDAPEPRVSGPVGRLVPRVASDRQ